jgi:hypothetical protein
MAFVGLAFPAFGFAGWKLVLTVAAVVEVAGLKLVLTVAAVVEVAGLKLVLKVAAVVAKCEQAVGDVLIEPQTEIAGLAERAMIPEHAA